MLDKGDQKKTVKNVLSMNIRTRPFAFISYIYPTNVMYSLW